MPRCWDLEIRNDVWSCSYDSTDVRLVPIETALPQEVILGLTQSHRVVSETDPRWRWRHGRATHIWGPSDSVERREALGRPIPGGHVVHTVLHPKPCLAPGLIQPAGRRRGEPEHEATVAPSETCLRTGVTSSRLDRNIVPVHAGGHV